MLHFFQGGERVCRRIHPHPAGLTVLFHSRVITRQPLPSAVLKMFYIKTTPLLLPAPPYSAVCTQQPLHPTQTRAQALARLGMPSWARRTTAHTSPALRQRRKRELRKCSAHSLSKACWTMPYTPDNPCPWGKTSPATPQLTAPATTSRTEVKKSTKHLKTKD